MNFKKQMMALIALSCFSGLVAKTCSVNDRVTCIEIKEGLAEIQATQTDCCDSLNNCALAILNGLEDPPVCDQQIFIDQQFITTGSLNPITVSGSYCLIESVTGDLVIDADDVNINMNSFSISGGTNLISATGHSNITISGYGLLQSAATNGISMTTCTNVVVDAVDFENCPTALSFSDVNNFNVAGSSVVGSSTSGMVFDASVNGNISRCLLHDNTFGSGILLSNASSNVLVKDVNVTNNDGGATMRGFQVSGSSNCTLLNCKANQNLATSNLAGFYIFNASSDCLLKECYALSNGSNADASTNLAFNIAAANKIVIDSCTANDGASSNIAIGFDVNSSTNCCIRNSNAKRNAVGGFNVTTSSDCYVQNNTALSNTTGFEYDGSNSNVFLGNYAEGNGTNYSGVLSVIAFDTSAGEFRDPLNSCTAVSPSDWSNIAVEACP